MHRDTHITNIRGLNLTTPGECDGFCVNRQRVAVPLAISGGQIAVFEVHWQLENKGVLISKTAVGLLLCLIALFLFHFDSLLSALNQASYQKQPYPPSKTL